MNCVILYEIHLTEIMSYVFKMLPKFTKYSRNIWNAQKHIFEYTVGGSLIIFYLVK